MRWILLGGVLAWTLGGPASSKAAQNAPAWLVWWAEGQKAARASGKPILMVFR